MITIAINGFGRIGKNFFYALFDDEQALSDIELVAINGYNQPPEVLLYSIQYDTILGRYQKQVSIDGDILSIAGKKIKLLMARTPDECAWDELGVEWVVDCSGCYTKRDDALKHIHAGARKVLISAPAKGDDVTIVPGVNEDTYRDEHTIISLGSCTTNAIVPVLKVLNDTFSLVSGFMTTIHAYTNSQPVHDTPQDMKKVRKQRAAALNTIPTTTGATEGILRVLPELEGKIEAMALRVPVALGSLLDVTVVVEHPVTADAINAAFARAGATTSMPEIIDISYEPLVSSDYIGNNYSVTIDAELTKALGHVGKIYGWYDNEWAYSKRLKDFLCFIARRRS